jgi:hypothetical protein
MKNRNHQKGELMNKWIAIIALSVMAITASAADNKKKTTAPAKPPAPTVQPLVIPTDASPNSDGTYSWTDKAGKKWIFSKTPFGISKVQDMSGTPPAMPAAPVGQYVKAIDNGDTVKFERQSPFGTTKWEKKKTDLTDEERAVLERQNAAPEQKHP